MCKSLSTWKNSLSHERTHTHTHTHTYTHTHARQRQTQLLIPIQIRYTLQTTLLHSHIHISKFTAHQQYTVIPKITQRGIDISPTHACVTSHTPDINPVDQEGQQHSSHFKDGATEVLGS